MFVITIDINECAEERLHQCLREDQICVNTIGSYYCKLLEVGQLEKFNNCPSGFKRTINSTTNQAECTDIDECATDADTCRDDLEVCINSHGTYQCQSKGSSISERMICPKGFRFHRFLYECQDINECKSGQHECHLETEKCTNTLGSYLCESNVNKPEALNLVSCPQGFEWNSGHKRCEDIDECRENGWKHVCPTNAVCQNTMGTYQCFCEVID